MGLKNHHRIVPPALLGLALLTASCSAPEPASDFPVVDGWTRSGEVLTYDADNLWEYIDGAAELFVEFGILTCRTADLAAGGVAVTVDLYDMGSPLNAYGVYERERPDLSISVPGATAAVLSPPYQALLLKGSTYVKVNTFDGELTEELGRELLQAIARSLPGDTTLPSELGLLPARGMVAGTAGYKPEAFLGQAALTDCLYAEYAGEGEDGWQGFVVLPGAAPTVWDALAGSWKSMEHNGSTVLFTEVPYSGFVGIMRTERGVFGVAEAPDQATMLARLDALTG